MGSTTPLLIPSQAIPSPRRRDSFLSSIALIPVGTPTSGTARASNFELLRILAMLLILVLHANFLAFRFPTNEAIHSQPLTSLGQVWSEALAIVGVNVFILISGYFGIKARIKGIVSLLFQAFFYTVGVYSTLVLLGLEPFSLSEFMGSLMPLNRKSEWFLPTYLSLMIFSPLLNALAQRTSEQELRRYLLLFFLVEFVLGFINDQLEVKDGYSLFAFAGIYLIGRYLRLYPQRLERWNGRTFLLGYFGLTFAQSLALFLFAYGTGQSIVASPLAYKFMSYVSPINILAAVLLFLAFSRIKVQSAAINWIGSSTLAVYLIHCNARLIGRYTGFIQVLSEQHPMGLFIVSVVGFILLVFAGSILIDKLRLLLWRWVISPLYDGIARLWVRAGLPIFQFPELRN